MAQEKPILDYWSGGGLIGVNIKIQLYQDGKVVAIAKGYDWKSHKDVDEKVELSIPSDQVASYVKRLVEEVKFFDLEDRYHHTFGFVLDGPRNYATLNYQEKSKKIEWEDNLPSPKLEAIIQELIVLVQLNE